MRTNFQPSPIAALRHIAPHVTILSSVALVLSAVMAWATMGTGDAFLPRWGRGFITSLVTLPLVLAGLGALEQLVNRHCGLLHRVVRKILVSLLTALVLESVLALAVTLINTPWSSPWAQPWWLAFSRSLPLGVAIGLFIGFYLKPRLDRMRLARQ